MVASTTRFRVVRPDEVDARNWVVPPTNRTPVVVTLGG